MIDFNIPYNFSPIFQAGWGYYDIDEPKSSHVLQVIRLPVVNIDECRKVKQLSEYEIGPGQLCVGGITGKGKKA